jgi:hypothetical protein
MQIAILPSGYLARIDFEHGLRRFTGAEKLPVNPIVVGNRFNPLNMMFVFHGMGHTAYLYLEAALDFFDHRDMLFFCRVNGILGKQFHWRAAADKLALAFVQHFHDIPTDFTFIDL